ncbi:MAG: hypothetical protein Q7W55_16765 [Pseudohongiella sp.]|nr:hypothetical protein [Pseudohongiella sp.]MDP2125941.1 hypothetical protein [Pseudohongiella sp.]
MSFFLDAYVIDAIRDGRFAFAYGPHPLIVLLLLALIPALVWFLYRRTTRPLTPRWKSFLVGLRSAVLILLLFMLMRPIITTFQVNPQETYLAVLVDDSASMQITDTPGAVSRQQAVTNTLYGDNGILAGLSERYQVRTFAFNQSVRRVSDAAELRAEGNASGLDQAMRQVADQLGGLPLSAVLMISDGADNSGADPLVSARELAARQIPVFTVGVGQEQIPRDVGINSVSAANTILDNTVFDVQVDVVQQGYSGRQVNLRVMDGETEVASRLVTLGEDGSSRRFDLEVTPERKEPILYELRVDELDGEIVLQNNRYQFLVDNSEQPALNILYVEGHPRNEFKFIRRAVESDTNLRLASYLRTGPGRFYRQGINSPLELSNGFPTRVEDLYQYQAVVMGDIGRDFFTDDQLKMLQDFVAERGGGLVVAGMLDDAFADSVLADVMPLTLARSDTLPGFLQGGIRRGMHATGELYAPRLTAAGEFSQLLRLDSDDASNRRLWSELPTLQGVYVTGRAKPGATVLLEHPVLQYQNQALPVIATQRYGSGRSMNINTASTWRWQMLMSSQDESHERLWRQMLRWLAQDSLERVTINFDKAFYNAGDTVNVSVKVLDARYKPDNNASLWIQRTDPLGNSADLAMEWDINQDGTYVSRFEATEEGVYRVLVDVASAAGSGLETEKPAAFVVTPSLREFNNAGRDVGMLARIAESSGGRYYDLSDARQLLTDIDHVPGAYSREVQEDLWDKPWLLALLIALMCMDWMARRYRGLS